MAEIRIFLTTTGAGTWTVPNDCTSATIEVIGGGGSGGGSDSNSGGSGGGGGAYAKKLLTLNPGDSISYNVGASNGDTWFDGEDFASSSVGAKRGGYGTGGYSGTPGLGGDAASCIGDVKYSGGNGGGNAQFYSGGGGGGGAAGPNGNGENGTAGSESTQGSGGTGGNGSGGVGGTSSQESGGNGTEWDATHGSGGGGAGERKYDSSWGGAGNGGFYGAGGGGNGYSANSQTIGQGIQGLIVITYTPVVLGSSNFFQLF